MRQLQQAIELCHRGKFEQAKNLLLELEQLHEFNDEACFIMGSVMGQLREYEAALDYYQQAIDLAPDKLRAWFGKAKVLLWLGRIEDAETCYDHLIERQPGSSQVILELATMLLNHSRYDAAIQRFLQVLEQDANSTAALSGLGRAYHALHKSELAKNYYQKAIEADPADSNNHYMLGTLLYSQGRVEEAEASYNKALELDENNVSACRDLGYLHLSLNRPEEARKQFQHALALQPRNLDVIAALARLEDQSGNLQAAYDLVHPFIERNVPHAAIGIVYASICRHFDCCQNAADNLERLLAGTGKQPAGNENLHFALGNLYDRLGEYDRAFAHFDQGNKQKADSFNETEEGACIDELIRTCDWNYFVAAPRSSQTTERPVFIVGMPRSGTTLTEQILASHPDVHGLGEIGVFPNIIRNLQSYLGVGTTYPGNLRRLTQGILDSMATNYLEGIGKLGPANTLRVTDKTLVNFLYLGLISQMFPKARVIHCMRDPRDTCLSIYFQNFDESHYYASRLKNLGVYYVLYQRVMRHWKSLLEIPILEMQYEDLVNNQEKKSKELIEFVGLEWDERVLRFFETERSVVTASYDQVRQKIYTKSTARWKNYEKHIGPLVKLLQSELERDT